MQALDNFDPGDPGEDTDVPQAIPGTILVHRLTPPDPVTLGTMPPWEVAFLRATPLAILQGLAAFGLTAQSTHDPWKLTSAVIAAFVIAYGVRGGAEAVVDTARAHSMKND